MILELDWSVAIGNRDVRMKTDHDKTTATVEVVSSHPEEIRQWKPKNGSKHRTRSEKPVADKKMSCKIMKQDQNRKIESTLAVGMKPYGKSRLIPADLE